MTCNLSFCIFSATGQDTAFQTANTITRAAPPSLASDRGMDSLDIIMKNIVMVAAGVARLHHGEGINTAGVL